MFYKEAQEVTALPEVTELTSGLELCSVLLHALLLLTTTPRRYFVTEKRDEVVYYDTYESMEAMLEKEELAASVHLQREELQKLQQKARQLEARRGRVSAKKAYLRNKKV